MESKQTKWRKRSQYYRRLLGIYFEEVNDEQILTTRELSIIKEINNLRDLFIREFKENSRDIGYKETKKCKFCGKKLNKIEISFGTSICLNCR